MGMKVSKRSWTRPIASPIFEQSAAYEAWILEWSDPRALHSRCSIYVEMVEDANVNAMKTFDSSEGSTSGRAISAAFLGVLEALPVNSRVIVHTCMSWVAARIERLAEDDVEHVLVNTDGSDVAHREIWEKAIDLMRVRNIRLAVPSNDNQAKNKHVFGRLREKNQKTGTRKPD